MCLRLAYPFQKGLSVSEINDALAPYKYDAIYACLVRSLPTILLST